MKINWPTKKLGEIINPQYGYTAPAKDEGDYRFVRITDIDEDGKLKRNDKKYISASLAEIKKYILAKGDLLVARTGSIGRMLYFDSDEPSIFASYLIRLNPDTSQVFSKYLWLFSHTPNYWRQVGLSASGAVQPQFNANRIKGIKILLPPLSTQQKIVERLDAIRKAQELNDKQVALAEDLFRSLLHKELDSKGKNWEVKKIGDIVEVTSSKRIFQSEYITDGIPFYRTKEIVELSQNKPISLELFISEKRFDEINKKFGVPQKGDILISAVGTIGISWVVPDRRKFYFKDGNLLWIKNFNGIDSYYLKLVLDNIFKSISQLAAGAAYNALTIIKLKKIKIPVPRLKTQRQIVEKLQAAQNYKKKLLAQKQKLQELFESCLDKAMKGELVK